MLKEEAFINLEKIFDILSRNCRIITCLDGAGFFFESAMQNRAHGGLCKRFLHCAVGEKDKQDGYVILR